MRSAPRAISSLERRELLALLVGRALRGEPGGLGLERRAHLRDAGEVADVDARHEHAAAGEDLDELLLRELPQRLPYRRAPDAELVRIEPRSSITAPGGSSSETMRPRIVEIGAVGERQPAHVSTTDILDISRGTASVEEGDRAWRRQHLPLSRSRKRPSSGRSPRSRPRPGSSPTSSISTAPTRRRSRSRCSTGSPTGRTRSSSASPRSRRRSSARARRRPRSRSPRASARSAASRSSACARRRSARCSGSRAEPPAPATHRSCRWRT